ncbi:YceI family protein [Chryseobacterium koreense]
MKKITIASIISFFVLGFLVISCGKEKPIVVDSSEITTIKDGTVFQVDTLNSKIEWKGYKIFKSDNFSHFGTIKFESGDVTMQNGEIVGGKFVADMGTLENVDMKSDLEQKTKLESHLKSTDFFAVEKFPTASYEITKVTRNESGDYNTTLDGNLTIKGISKPAKFNANISMKDGEVSIATEPTDIKREDFGVKFQIPVANGVIKDEVNLQILIKALEKK